MNTAKRNVSVNVKRQHCALDGVFKATSGRSGALSGFSMNTTNRRVLIEEVSVSYVRTVCGSPSRRQHRSAAVAPEITLAYGKGSVLSADGKLGLPM